MAKDVGHLLDDDTILLYKNRDTSVGNTAHAGPLEDKAGNYTLTPTTQREVMVTWGPAGSSKRDVFARYFTRWRSGSEYIISGVIDQALIDANRVDHTYELLFRFDSQVAGEDFIISIGGPPSGSASLDWLFRFGRFSDGRITLWWERFDSDERANTTSTTLVPNESWHVAHVTRKEDPGNPGSFLTSLYIDGVFAESWGVGFTSYASGSGLIPAATSGTANQIWYGNGGGINDFNGYIGSSRLITELMTPSEIAAAAATLLADGTIAYEPARTQFHHAFDDPPMWLDESPTGFHSQFQGNFYSGSGPHQLLDFVNEPSLGGRPRGVNNSPAYVDQYALEVEMQARHGKSLIQVFNDDLGVPTWTAEAWVLHLAQGLDATHMLVQFDGASGESLSTNVLVQAGIQAGSFTPYNFHEIGSGTNVGGLFGDNPLFDTSLGEQYQIYHLAVRSREDPSNPGQQIHEWFVNGLHRSTVGPMTPPQGGTHSDNLLKFFSNGWDSWVQEFKLSAVARTDQEIYDDAHRLGPLGVVSGVAAVLNSRGGTMKAQYIASESLRIVIPPFFNTADNTYITTGDVVTLTIKKPDDTLYTPAPTPTRDADTDFWVAEIPVGQFLAGEWLIKAESDNPDALPQYRLLLWGDFVDDVFQATLGRWKIESNQLKLYKSDGLTVLRTYDLLDNSGLPSSTQIFERNPA